jgi:hypothetical protein
MDKSEPNIRKHRFSNVKRIELADSTLVHRHRESMDSLLRTMGFSLDSVLVTDLSSVGDFLSEESELSELSKSIGFPVRWNDLLIDIAMRLERPT